MTLIKFDSLDKIMTVNLKDLNIESPMKLNDKGIELSIYDGSKHVGDLLITNSRVIWCQGKTTPENGRAVSWARFIETMKGRA
jgi:hypothetical protein